MKGSASGILQELSYLYYLLVALSLRVVLGRKLLRGHEGDGISGRGDLLHRFVASVSIGLDLFMVLVCTSFHLCRVFYWYVINYI